MHVVREGSRLICTVVVDQVWQDFAFAKLVQQRLQAGDTELVLDLAHIDMLHSPGLANLVSLHVHCEKRGIRFAIRRVNDANRKLLRSTRLDHLLSIED